MSPEAIVGLTAAISIAFHFLEPVHPNMQIAQNLQEERLLAFDKIVSACKLLIEQIGRPKFMTSVWQLWSQLSQAMFTLERTLWPNQPLETPLNIMLPQQSRPLSDVLLDNFDQHATFVLQAITPLEHFHQWFISEYDIVLHAEFNEMLIDSLLLFRTVETMLRMKRRLQTLLPPPADTAAAPPAEAPTTAASAAATAAPATGETEMTITNAAGEVLSWY